MDPNAQNNQINLNSNPAPQPAPIPEPNAAPMENTAQSPITPDSTSRKTLIIGIIIAAIIVLVAGTAIYFYMSSSPANEITPTPTPISRQSTESTSDEIADVAEVNTQADLENLIVKLAEADSTLEQELSALDKDSSF